MNSNRFIKYLTHKKNLKKKVKNKKAADGGISHTTLITMN
jgi:hypothetical protein